MRKVRWWRQYLGPFALVLLLIGNVFPSFGGVSLALVGAIVAVPIVVLRIGQSLPRVPAVVIFTIILICVVGVPGVLDPPVNTYGIEKVTKLWTITLFSALAVVIVRNSADVRRLAVAWLISGLVLAVATLLGFTADTVRASAFDANPIWLARALGSALVAAAWLAGTRILRPVLFLICGGLVGSAILLTQSRGPLVGLLAAGLVLVIYLTPRVTPLVVSLSSFLVAGLLGWWAFFASRDTLGRVVELLANPGEALTASRRTELWEATLPVIVENPWGVGYGNWATAAGYVDKEWPHNLFLEVLAEGGWIPGIALVGVTAVITARLAIRARRDGAALLLLIWLVESTIQVSVSGDLNARTFFAFLALGFAVIRFGGAEAGSPSALELQSSSRRRFIHTR